MPRQCATLPMLLNNMEKTPQLRTRFAQARAVQDSAGLEAAPAPRNIPIVVHVLYKNAADNISDAQIESQITVLNDDFNNLNSDLNLVPAAFKPAIGNHGVSFHLTKTNPAGAPSSGITRKQVQVDSFAVDNTEAMKFSALGGVDAWDTARFLNIWVCRLSGGILGYAQFPAGGLPATDGVVILTTAFGVGGTANPPFDLGRTATHEVGHYLGLFHVWGNNLIPDCNDSDEVADTPNQLGPNFDKPAFPRVSCPLQPNGDMFMNYMDYVDDAAMFMFTAQQVVRMHQALAVSRPQLGVGVPVEA
jgi:hypothetical protein